ncbi:MAG: right-handed parallel beta-helix repeat-containing protein [Verrucomicrobiales bacterium]
MRKIARSSLARAIGVLFCLVACLKPVLALEFNVPGDFTTIADALAVVPNDATIVVGPGEWNDSISLTGAIRLVASSSQAVLSSNRIAVADTPVLSGFTILGVVGVDGGTPTIERNIFQGAGAGMEIRSSNPTISANRFVDSKRDVVILIYWSSKPQIESNVFANNSGTCIRFDSNGTATGTWNIEHNAFVMSAVGISRGASASKPMIQYNIFAHLDYAVVGSDLWGGAVENNLFHSNHEDFASGATDQIGFLGNRDVDPEFVSLSAGDYRLREGSPGIDTAIGSTAVVSFDGTPRHLGGESDIGPYELDPASGPSNPELDVSPPVTEAINIGRIGEGMFAPPVELSVAGRSGASWVARSSDPRLVLSALSGTIPATITARCSATSDFRALVTFTLDDGTIARSTIICRSANFNPTVVVDAPEEKCLFALIEDDRSFLLRLDRNDGMVQQAVILPDRYSGLTLVQEWPALIGWSLAANTSSVVITDPSTMQVIRKESHETGLGTVVASKGQVWLVDRNSFMYQIYQDQLGLNLLRDERLSSTWIALSNDGSALFAAAGEGLRRYATDSIGWPSKLVAVNPVSRPLIAENTESGKRIVAVNNRIFDDDLNQIGSLGHEIVAISPDGNMVVTELGLYRVSDGEILYEWSGPVEVATFLADGSAVAVQTARQPVSIIALPESPSFRILTVTLESGRLRLQFNASPGQRFVVEGSASGIDWTAIDEPFFALSETGAWVSPRSIDFSALRHQLIRVRKVE